MIRVDGMLQPQVSNLDLRNLSDTSPWMWEPYWGPSPREMLYVAFTWISCVGPHGSRTVYMDYTGIILRVTQSVLGYGIWSALRPRTRDSTTRQCLRLQYHTLAWTPSQQAQYFIAIFETLALGAANIGPLFCVWWVYPVQ